jgi:hypothetical protein
MDHSYLPKDGMTIERKSRKGRRLYILRAIRADGPLCATGENGRPIDKLVYKGWIHATQHLKRTERTMVSYETLWIAQSHTGGNYPDNMSSKMFMPQHPKRVRILVSTR